MFEYIIFEDKDGKPIRGCRNISDPDTYCDDSFPPGVRWRESDKMEIQHLFRKDGKNIDIVIRNNDSTTIKVNFLIESLEEELKLPKGHFRIKIEEKMKEKSKEDL